MTIKRGDNARGFNTPIVAVGLDDEMNALEILGPISRHAICNGPIKFSAATVVMSFQGRDLKDQDTDKHIAREILLRSMMIVAQDRSREDAMASVQPLRSKASPKSLREQRRAMRASRW